MYRGSSWAPFLAQLIGKEKLLALLNGELSVCSHTTHNLYSRQWAGGTSIKQPASNSFGGWLAAGSVDLWPGSRNIDRSTATVRFGCVFVENMFGFCPALCTKTKTTRGFQRQNYELMLNEI